jgi:hypothetical protein
MFKRIPDTFFVGIIIGMITLFLSYLAVKAIRILLVNHYDNEYLMAPPRVQLYSIVINVIIFRFMMVRFDRENTGKGILFSTIILALIYFYFYLRFNFRMD